MLKFEYTCQRHQELFVNLLTCEGCTDPAAMDQIRKRVLAWLSEKYPMIVFEHYSRKSCVGCDLEEAHIGLSDTVNTIRDLARGAARS